MSAVLAPRAVLPRLLADDLGPLTVPGDLIAVLRAAGLRGRGGGAFPTADKLDAVLAQRGRPIVVANGAEGEPASSKDRGLARVAPQLILDGVVAVATALRARHAVVALADDAVEERRSLERAVAERGERLPIEIAAVPAGFVVGEETALLSALAGGRPKPTLKPPYPFERGLDGAPTLVQNVETLAHVGLIARYGAGWFREAGSSDAPGTALVTIKGAVGKPGVHEIELGTTLADVVAQGGGPTTGVQAYLVGGYFGGWVPARAAATYRLTPDTLGAGAIVAFPEQACPVADCVRVVRYLADESAGQCGPCVNGLGAIADALDEHAHGRDRRPQLERWAGMVTGRGACRHPDGAARFVESALTVFAEHFAHHAKHGRCRLADRAVLPL